MHLQTRRRADLREWEQRIRQFQRLQAFSSDPEDQAGLTIVAAIRTNPKNHPHEPKIHNRQPHRANQDTRPHCPNHSSPPPIPTLVKVQLQRAGLPIDLTITHAALAVVSHPLRNARPRCPSLKAQQVVRTRVFAVRNILIYSMFVDSAVFVYL